MNELTIAQPLVFEHRGAIFANSIQVARHFERRHDNVLQAIRDLLLCEEINPSWIVETTYVDEGGRTYPAYNLTRDGFTLLAMGFTTDKALHFKLQYMAAYNEMEKTLRQLPVVVKPVNASQLREVRLALSNPRFANLSQASQDARAAAFYRAIGMAMPDPVIPSKKFYTAIELHERFSFKSPIAFGKAVHSLQCDAHGETRLTTYPNGKQGPQWHWNERGVDAIEAFLADTAPKALTAGADVLSISSNPAGDR